MKKIYQILLMMVLCLGSCVEYEYQWPENARLPYQIEFQTGDFLGEMIDLIHDLGYDISGWSISEVIEKDANGDTLWSYHLKEMHSVSAISKEGAKKIDVIVTYYGWAKSDLAKHNKTEVCSILFKNIELNELDDANILLNSKMAYEIDISSGELQCQFKVILGGPSTIDIVKEMGYEFASSGIAKIVEKDKYGKILYEGLKTDHPSLEYSTASKGAKIIDVYIDFYGRHGSSSSEKLGSIKFENIPLKENGEIIIYLDDYQYTIETVSSDNLQHSYIVILGGPSTIDIVKEMGYEFASSGIAKIVEKDKYGKILYEGLKTDHPSLEYSTASKGTKIVDVYIDFYGRHGSSSSEKLGSIKFENIPLNENGETIIYLEDYQYTIETVSSDNLQHSYIVNLGGPSTIDIVKGMGYDFASSGIAKIVEKDKDGKILYNGLRTSHPSFEYSIAAKGTKTVDVYIDFYGRHGVSSSEKLGSIKFENIPLNEYGETIIYLDKYPYTVCTEDLTHQYKIKTSDYYFVTGNGYSPFEIKEQVKNMGYDYVSSEMTGVIERDIKGTVLYQGEIKKPNGYSISEEGARTIDILIDYYGWTDANTNKTKVLTVVIHNISLNKFGETDISPYNQPYTIKY